VSALLSIENLKAGYGHLEVLHGVSLEVREGEIVALLGSNGAGKTTTLRAASGMVRVRSGRVVLAGKDISNRPPDLLARMGLNHIPEGRGLFPRLEVDETLRLAGIAMGVAGRDFRERLEQVFAVFPRLAERRRQAVGTLSGGEQQMVTLSRALIARPRVLLVDELSQGLAPTLVAELFEILTTLPPQGTAVLLVEQFVGQALEVAQRAYVVEKGVVTFEGPASKLLADEEFVAGSYLGHAGEARAAARAPSGSRTVGAVTLAEEYSLFIPAALKRGLEERARREGVDPQDLLLKMLEEQVRSSARGKESTP